MAETAENGMENIINVKTFIQNLTYYIKIGIYINKGTTSDSILERCIKIYNKYKTIESSEVMTESDETFIRKCYKRLNLILKINKDGTPVDIRVKENQSKMIFLEPHMSIVKDDLGSMEEYATKNNINILTEIPLMFILRESKYKELLWQYTRSLFYISQILICQQSMHTDSVKQNIFQNIFDGATKQLELILENIAEIEEKIKLNQIMALDKYLNTKLIKTGINEKNINVAKQEIKEMFVKKGIQQDRSVEKMIDSISEKIAGISLDKQNVVSDMYNIASMVANEMKSDIEADPDKFQNTVVAITEIFKETMEDTCENNNKVPDDIKGTINTLLSSMQDNNEPNDETIKSLENIMESNCINDYINKEQFFGSIKDNDGKINIKKMQNYLENNN
ncbi:MAG: hypothetical protein Satyrvirus9_8 [Satyrvirus sp.]|uniref:Uncharacterized protein n=1 Tax=Satyrvirus sp. TaxID=2487771 RepID=A0A3G5ADM7_9VIRU|nr:MAG: hypothetical protein Satyrvirus9_8 [Satyrvirus sp.]